MFHRNNLLYLLLLPWIIDAFQINLYYTEWNSINDNDDAFQHDCLRLDDFEKEGDQQSFLYCLGESSRKFSIETNGPFQKFTFADLFKKKITIQQLYRWSASIDTIENYQLYLTQLSTSNGSSLSMNTFYNCTSPRFGSFCQYQFKYYDPNYRSLYNLFYAPYYKGAYDPSDLTCYKHLKCDRGPFPSCLDWSEICDGKIDCLNGGIDEKDCWQLEMNECQKNEYRCRNGQCIPQSFLRNSKISFDCLDGSDQVGPSYCLQGDDYYLYFPPSYLCEDLTCRFSPFTSSCIKSRENLLMTARYSNKDDFPSEICRKALLCLIEFPYIDDLDCEIFCEENSCSNIIENDCSNVLYFSSTPILFNDIYFAHTKNDSSLDINNPSGSLSICYNTSYYDQYFINIPKIFINNMTCIHSSQIIVEPSITDQIDPRQHYRDKMRQLYEKLYEYHLSFDYTLEICQQSNMYQCMNSSKCISIYRLLDGINDCSMMDDENLTAIQNSHRSEYIKNNHFYCKTLNKYIRRSLVSNRICDCNVPDADWCEDEPVDVIHTQNNIGFQYVCDGFVDLLPKLIDGRNETDETECEQWECDNIYTHCDHIWNCPNGADELDCFFSSSILIDCSSEDHKCISRETYEFICLPIEKANDGNIDCLGATDELELCGKYIKMMSIERYRGFHCVNDGSSLCLDKIQLCDGEKQCENGDDEQFCSTNLTMVNDHRFCGLVMPRVITVPKFFCFYRTYLRASSLVEIKLNEMPPLNIIPMKRVENGNKSMSSVRRISDQSRSHCHRGLDLFVWLNNTEHPTCLCPPSLYGDQCQYQNQRISLTLQFRSSSDSWQTLFSIVISLIDDGEEGIIHSHEQISYLSIENCQTRYYFSLLYATRPKDSSKNYSIQIDFYEKNTLSYRGSRLFPVQFLFLPVHRLAYLVDIPSLNVIIPSCIEDLCIHGRCFGYLDPTTNRTFCRCHRGWTGRYCTIPHQCACSSNSLHLGRSANSRSICLCPLNTFGPRCLLVNLMTHDEDQRICDNNGTYIPIDLDGVTTKKYICICLPNFRSHDCELLEKKFLFSASPDIILSQSILFHFLKTERRFHAVNGQHEFFPTVIVRSSTFRTIPLRQDSVTLSWSHDFEIGFVELRHQQRNYYFFRYDSNEDAGHNTSIKHISSSNRCPPISDLFNETVIQLDLVRRIKYYHFPCQRRELNLSCFYDDEQICYCYSFGEKRLSNCFRFDHNMTFDCDGENDCENGAKCFLDDSNCPKQLMCLCEPCSFGRKCQLSASGFGLSLDAIIGYHIQQKIAFLDQSVVVKISLTLTMIIFFGGLMDGILCLIAFKNKSVHEVGCGLYLLGLSITTLLTMTTFGLKYFVVLLSQMNMISNGSLLKVQCLSLDWILRVCVCIDQWLNACVAIERTMISIKGPNFNKKKSKDAVKFVVTGLCLLTIMSCIHDPFHRRLVDEEDDDGQEKRTWCIVQYSSGMEIYNSITYSFHFFGPFLINLISSIILIKTKTRQYMKMHPSESYKTSLINQFAAHKHLLIGPIVLVILALPRLIITFVSKCMESADDVWLYLIGYYISFIPTISSFVIFVLPSKFYRQEFQKSLLEYRVYRLYLK